jgi:hypothetical protein
VLCDVVEEVVRELLGGRRTVDRRETEGPCAGLEPPANGGGQEGRWRSRLVLTASPVTRDRP